MNAGGAQMRRTRAVDVSIATGAASLCASLFASLFAALLGVALGGCEPALGVRVVEDPREADAWALRRGMTLVEEMSLTYQIMPPRVARLSAYAALAHHEAIVPFIDGARSLSQQIDGMPTPPVPEEGAYDATSAGVAALSRVVRVLVPQDWLLTPGPIVEEMLAWREEELARRVDAVGEDVVARSVAYGDAVADVLAPWMNDDGFLARRQPWDPPDVEGGWRPTDESQLVPLEPFWHEVRALVVRDVDACDPGPPPAFSTAPGAAFFDAAHEVLTIAQTRTPEQEQIAWFWHDSRRTTTPPGHWLAILHIVVESERLPLAEASAAYALLGVALHDAFVASWTSKYTHYVQRPITFIRDHLDPTFTPLFLTPAHPSYTSGHATSSHAAAAVLAARLGDIRVTDTSRADDERGLAPRTFDTFEQAAAEAAISRVFAGIHYRFDADAGEAQGDCVGSHVAALDVGY